MPPLLRPSAPTASDALLCGDPARALAIAQHLMELPRMSNHNRGLWGYFGQTRAGVDLTVQGTGIGAPSAVAVLEELVGLGVERVIRVGTCRAGDGYALGDALVVTSAIAEDGTSRAMGVSGRVDPDEALTAELLAASATAGGAAVSSSDLRGSEPPAGGLADMQTAGLLAAARSFGVPAAAVLVVVRVGDRPLADQPTEAALLDAAARAAGALGRRSEHVSEPERSNVQLEG